ncbi:MAG: class I SAM-dependent rRNA methyltransferase, partial [Bacteroidota bacterium]
MHQLRLKKFADRRLRAGHLWIFSNELLEIPRLEAGEVVEVIDYPGQNHGVAFYNPNTLVAARLLKHSAAPDLEFFRQRLRMAEDYRRRALDEHGAYRLSFAESDYLPGLLIDRFGDYFSFEILSVGMENHKSIILEAIAMEFPDAKGIFEKNKSRWREIEGLPLREEVVFGEIPDEFEISENGVRLLVSLREGQKTGYYLDQKYNRRAAAEVSNGADVLDLFCNQGGFALTAAIYGASSVTGVDSSAPAIERARRNAEINGFDSAEFIEADVFDYIDQQISAGKKWDVVISDPPAFAKSKKHRPKAEAAY